MPKKAAVRKQAKTRGKRVVCSVVEGSNARKLEEEELNAGATCVFGVDEAGRGPIAGPVVAAACWIPSNTTIPGVKDSKLISSESQREATFDRVTSAPGVAWAYSVVTASVIDQINVLQAALLAMQRSAAAVLGRGRFLKRPADPLRVGSYVVRGGAELAASAQRKPVALIDGPFVPESLPCGGRAVVGGDGSEFAIAAASLVAKVYRDRIMRALHSVHPGYGLLSNKGYPSPAHLAAVRRIGPSPVHRLTYGPVARAVEARGGAAAGTAAKRRRSEPAKQAAKREKSSRPAPAAVKRRRTASAKPAAKKETQRRGRSTKPSPAAAAKRRRGESETGSPAAAAAKRRRSGRSDTKQPSSAAARKKLAAGTRRRGSDA